MITDTRDYGISELCVIQKWAYFLDSARIFLNCTHKLFVHQIKLIQNHKKTRLVTFQGYEMVRKPKHKSNGIPYYYIHSLVCNNNHNFNK